MAEQAVELVKLEGQREELLGPFVAVPSAERPDINTDAELLGAMEFLSKLRILKKETENIRQFFVRPLNEHIKAINNQFKDFLKPIEEAEGQVSLAIQLYRQVQLKQQKEEQALLQQQAEEELAQGGSLIPEAVATVAQAPVKKMETTIGSAGFAKNWTYCITDEKKIPREYLILDRGKILKVVKALKQDANIPGVEVYYEEIPVVRGR